MATYRQRGDSWEVQVRRKGHAYQVEAFSRKTDAVKWARKIESEIDAGRRPVRNRAHTLDELIERYRLHVLSLPEYSLLERSKRESKLRWWSARLGKRLLRDIRPSDIADAKASLATGEGGNPAAPATQVRYLALLSHVFSYAVLELGEEWLSENPATAKKVKRPKEPKGRVRFLDPRSDERERLLAACQGSHDRRLYPLVLMALATGARAGELMALRWHRVNLHEGAATLDKTKNGNGRALPLIPQVIDALRAMPRRISADDFIFAGPRGKAAFPREAWERAVREAGVEDFHFHDLRHTFASYLAMSGASLPELAAALGHKTFAMVLRYTHLSPPHVHGVVHTMGERFLA